MDNQTVITAAELKLKSRPIVGSVIIPTVYSTGGNCDLSNASGQKDVSVAAPTSTMAAGDRVIIGKGTTREEEAIIDSVDADVKIVLLTNLTYNHTVTQEQTLDQESAAAQKNVYIAATANLLAGETVVISAGEAEEESGVIDSVTLNDYITLVADLTNTHAIGRKCKHTAPAGISVVEVAEAFLSKVIDKTHYKNLALSLPSDWTTAIITFVGCMTEDGTFLPIVNADDVGETTIASVAASMCIALNGEIKEAMAAIPFIKFRSGVLATPVDQGNGDVSISYALTR